MRTVYLALTASILTSSALAAPGELAYQGRLTDTEGQPLNGTQSITIGLYAQASDGTAVWSETDTVDIVDGYFATTLGDQLSLSSVDFGSTSLWVGITPASGDELLPRTPLQAAPVALSVVGGGAPGAGPLVFGRTSPGSTYAWIEFPRPMNSDPVIIATVNELNDSGAVPNRVVQSGRSGFGWTSWNCSSADVADSMSYIAAEPGVHTIDGQTVEAGHLGPTSGIAFTIPFAATFEQLPVVLLTVDERGDNTGATACRIESLSTTEATGRCWSNSTGADADGLYYLALEPTSAAGLAYNGRRIHAGRATGATGATLHIPTPESMPGVPGVMALTVENSGTSGGPSIARTHLGSDGTSVETRSWHCPSGEARTPYALHWLFID